MANNPVPKQIKKILQSDFDFSSTGFPSLLGELFSDSVFTENCSIPLGNSAPDLASQLKLPLIFWFSPLQRAGYI